MASLFTVRSIMIMALGLLVGGLLGWGYWHISPVDANVQAGWPPLRVAGITNSRPSLYRSTVDLQVVARGEIYTSQKTLQYQGEYLEGKLGSRAFYQSLSQEVEKLDPQYSHTPEELDEMISSKYEYGSADATVQLRVDSQDPDEAVFLAGIVPEILQTHLMAEERAKWSIQYEDTLAEFDKVATELAEATEELNDVKLAVGATDRDPAYIVADAKVRALSGELDGLTRDLASAIAEGATGDEYEDILEQLDRVSIALAEARSELASLEARAEAQRRELNLDYSAASAKVGALDRQIGILARMLVSLSTEEPEELEVFSLVTVGEPSDPEVMPRDRIRGRNALMMGALLGLGGAWVGLNYKGLVKGLGPSREDTAEPEEDGEA